MTGRPVRAFEFVVPLGVERVFQGGQEGSCEADMSAALFPDLA